MTIADAPIRPARRRLSKAIRKIDPTYTDEGVPRCSGECPAHETRYRKDGERYARSPYRCAVTGENSPWGICKPAVQRMSEELVQLRQQQRLGR